MELPLVEVGSAALAVEDAAVEVVMVAVGMPMKQFRRRSELSLYILPLVALCATRYMVCECAIVIPGEVGTEQAAVERQ